MTQKLDFTNTEREQAKALYTELKDKIATLGIDAAAGAPNSQPMSAANKAVQDEAVAALTMLGFSPAPTQKVVVAILQEQPALPVEQVVKLALKQIK
jgi:Holliday junction DNA helicase RuvA